MAEKEQKPVIPPSFEVLQEQAIHGARRDEDSTPKERYRLGHLLRRVKHGLADAAKSLVGEDSSASVRDYLPVNDPDRRIVEGYIRQVNEKFEINPELQRQGWEEIWLPDAVKMQGGNVTRAQANRLIATLAFRSTHHEAINPEADA